MIETPEPPHQHHKTGVRWFDLIMPLAVLCISFGALLNSLQSERSMQALVEQNRRLVDAQSTPLLMLDSSNMADGKSVLTMTVSNVGTGPAQIAWLHVLDSQGNSYSDGALWTRVAKLHSKSMFLSQEISSTLMRSGDQRLVFSWSKPVDNPAALAEWDKLGQTRFHLHASACYCSIFDECKITEFGASRPKPVPSCTQT
jgi:hypothetical protein